MQVFLLRIDLSRQPGALLGQETMLHSIYFCLASYEDNLVYHILHAGALHVVVVRSVAEAAVSEATTTAAVVVWEHRVVRVAL